MSYNGVGNILLDFSPERSLFKERVVKEKIWTGFSFRNTRHYPCKAEMHCLVVTVRVALRKAETFLNHVSLQRSRKKYCINSWPSVTHNFGVKSKAVTVVRGGLILLCQSTNIFFIQVRRAWNEGVVEREIIYNLWEGFFHCSLFIFIYPVERDVQIPT